LPRQHGEQLPAEPDAPALANFLLRRRVADPDNFADLSLSIVKLLGPGEYAVVEGEGSEGHFGLAVPRYTHSTAPNRRYADLVVQRLLKARASSGRASAPLPYTRDALAQIAARCTERENAARKVERTLRKMAAAALFGERIGDVFDAVVTGASNKGVYVRTVSPPVEGRVMRGEEDLDVGDRVRVRLVATNVDQGLLTLSGHNGNERTTGGVRGRRPLLLRHGTA
jgi:exoribonuclease-2